MPVVRVDKFHRQLGERIRAARVAAGYETAADCAREIDVEPPTFRKWERGESEPTYPQLIKLSRATRHSLDFIVSGVNGD